MKRILCLLLLLCSAFPMLAKPAKPGKIRHTQPDGSVIEMVKHGDEWGPFLTNTAGQVLRLDADGFYRVAKDVTPRAAARALAVRRQARRQAMARMQAGQTQIGFGQKRFLVILVEFQDVQFILESPHETISRMLNEPGFADGGATGSARDYYYDNSRGVFDPVFDVFGPVLLSHDMAYYGGNDNRGEDMRPEEAVLEGCTLLDGEIDFSQYDNDGDGEVDLVFMYYAGYSEADTIYTDAIWPHRWWLSYSGHTGPEVLLDGVILDNYACGSELCGAGVLDGIGTVCHEFGHVLGLPDFYDTNYSDDGETHGLSYFSLMDMGSYNNNNNTPPYLNAEERMIAGWMDPADMQEFSQNGEYNLPSISENRAYKIPADQEGEYFVLECRDGQGWDSELYGAKGLLVYHVDKSERKVGYFSARRLWEEWRTTGNAINALGSHPCFYLIPAADQNNLDYKVEYLSDLQKIPFPGMAGVTRYSPVSWNQVETDVRLSDITFADNQSRFTVGGIAPGRLDFPYIANPGRGSYAAGSSFPLEVVMPEGQELQSVRWKLDGKGVSGSSVDLPAGSHTLEANVTLADGKSYQVKLELKAQ